MKVANGPELANVMLSIVTSNAAAPIKRGLFCVNYAHQSRSAPLATEPACTLKPAPPPQIWRGVSVRPVEHPQADTDQGSAD